MIGYTNETLRYNLATRGLLNGTVNHRPIEGLTIPLSPARQCVLMGVEARSEQLSTARPTPNSRSVEELIAAIFSASANFEATK